MINNTQDDIINGVIRDILDGEAEAELHDNPLENIIGKDLAQKILNNKGTGIGT